MGSQSACLSFALYVIGIVPDSNNSVSLTPREGNVGAEPQLGPVAGDE